MRAINFYFFFFMILSSHPVQANANFTIRATITTLAPCIINGGRTIEVSFGNDLFVNRVETGEYRQPVGLTLNCPGARNNSMLLYLKGTPASFDRNLLQTNINGLGIRLTGDSKAFPINQPLNFNYPNYPVLEAILEKENNIELNTGEFTASATLQVFYQ